MPSPNGSTTPSVLDAALAYARRGWQVFPVKDRAKNPLTEHGFRDASSGAETIRWVRGAGCCKCGIVSSTTQ